MFQGPAEKVERRSPEPKKKRKKSLTGNGDEDDNDVESLDWWTKYHASVETTIKVLSAVTRRRSQLLPQLLYLLFLFMYVVFSSDGHKLGLPSIQLQDNVPTKTESVQQCCAVPRYYRGTIFFYGTSTVAFTVLFITAIPQVSRYFGTVLVRCCHTVKKTALYFD